MLEVLFGVINDEFEWLYLMLFVLVVVAHPTNHTFLNALGLEADKVEHFAYVLVAFGALGVFKMS